MVKGEVEEERRKVITKTAQQGTEAIKCKVPRRSRFRRPVDTRSERMQA